MGQWLCLLSSDLFSDLVELDITGGEPFLRDDLADFIAGVCNLRQNHLKSLKSIAITTNGFLTGRILTAIEQVLPQLIKNGMDLIIVCAMDAIGDLHAEIRNYKDAWAKTDQTVQGLKRLQSRFPSLVVGLKATVLPVNVNELDAIAGYADSNDLFTIISPCIITEGRYLNPDLADSLLFRPKQIKSMIRFFQRESSRWSYHENRLADYFRNGVMRTPCTCGFNYFFVRSNGDLFLCPLIDETIGNIKDVPAGKLLSSPEASRLRRRIGRIPQCRHCTEPGLERYALAYDGFSYLALFFKMGKKRFLQLHHHMGLDKYFRQSRDAG